MLKKKTRYIITLLFILFYAKMMFGASADDSQVFGDYANDPNSEYFIQTVLSPIGSTIKNPDRFKTFSIPSMKYDTPYTEGTDIFKDDGDFLNKYRYSGSQSSLANFFFFDKFDKDKIKDALGNSIPPAIYYLRDENKPNYPSLFQLASKDASALPNHMKFASFIWTLESAFQNSGYFDNNKDTSPDSVLFKFLTENPGDVNSQSMFYFKANVKTPQNKRTLKSIDTSLLDFYIASPIGRTPYPITFKPSLNATEQDIAREMAIYGFNTKQPLAYIIEYPEYSETIDFIYRKILKNELNVSTSYSGLNVFSLTSKTSGQDKRRARITNTDLIISGGGTEHPVKADGNVTRVFSYNNPNAFIPLIESINNKLKEYYSYVKDKVSEVASPLYNTYRVPSANSRPLKTILFHQNGGYNDTSKPAFSDIKREDIITKEGSTPTAVTLYRTKFDTKPLYEGNNYFPYTNAENGSLPTFENKYNSLSLGDYSPTYYGVNRNTFSAATLYGKYIYLNKEENSFKSYPKYKEDNISGYKLIPDYFTYAIKNQITNSGDISTVIKEGLDKLKTEIANRDLIGETKLVSASFGFNSSIGVDLSIKENIPYFTWVAPEKAYIVSNTTNTKVVYEGRIISTGEAISFRSSAIELAFVPPEEYKITAHITISTDSNVLDPSLKFRGTIDDINYNVAKISTLTPPTLYTNGTTEINGVTYPVAYISEPIYKIELSPRTAILNMPMKDFSAKIYNLNDTQVSANFSDLSDEQKTKVMMNTLILNDINTMTLSSIDSNIDLEAINTIINKNVRSDERRENATLVNNGTLMGFSLMKDRDFKTNIVGTTNPIGLVKGIDEIEIIKSISNYERIGDRYSKYGKGLFETPEQGNYAPIFLWSGISPKEDAPDSDNIEYLKNYTLNPENSNSTAQITRQIQQKYFGSGPIGTLINKAFDVTDNNKYANSIKNILTSKLEDQYTSGYAIPKAKDPNVFKETVTNPYTFNGVQTGVDAREFIFEWNTVDEITPDKIDNPIGYFSKKFFKPTEFPIVIEKLNPSLTNILKPDDSDITTFDNSSTTLSNDSIVDLNDKRYLLKTNGDISELFSLDDIKVDTTKINDLINRDGISFTNQTIQMKSLVKLNQKRYKFVDSGTKEETFLSLKFSIPSLMKVNKKISVAPATGDTPYNTGFYFITKNESLLPGTIPGRQIMVPGHYFVNKEQKLADITYGDKNGVLSIDSYSYNPLTNYSIGTLMSMQVMGNGLIQHFGFNDGNKYLKSNDFINPTDKTNATIKAYLNTQVINLSEVTSIGAINLNGKLGNYISGNGYNDFYFSDFDNTTFYTPYLTKTSADLITNGEVSSTGAIAYSVTNNVPLYTLKEESINPTILPFDLKNLSVPSVLFLKDINDSNSFLYTKDIAYEVNKDTYTEISNAIEKAKTTNINADNMIDVGYSSEYYNKIIPTILFKNNKNLFSFDLLNNKLDIKYNLTNSPINNVTFDPYFSYVFKSYLTQKDKDTLYPVIICRYSGPKLNSSNTVVFNYLRELVNNSIKELIAKNCGVSSESIDFVNIVDDFNQANIVGTTGTVNLVSKYGYMIHLINSENLEQGTSNYSQNFTDGEYYNLGDKYIVKKSGSILTFNEVNVNNGNVLGLGPDKISKVFPWEGSYNDIFHKLNQTTVNGVLKATKLPKLAPNMLPEIDLTPMSATFSIKDSGDKDIAFDFSWYNYNLNMYKKIIRQEENYENSDGKDENGNIVNYDFYAKAFDLRKRGDEYDFIKSNDEDKLYLAFETIVAQFKTTQEPDWKFSTFPDNLQLKTGVEYRLDSKKIGTDPYGMKMIENVTPYSVMDTFFIDKDSGLNTEYYFNPFYNKRTKSEDSIYTNFNLDGKPIGGNYRNPLIPSYLFNVFNNGLEGEKESNVSKNPIHMIALFTNNRAEISGVNLKHSYKGIGDASSDWNFGNGGENLWDSDGSYNKSGINYVIPKYTENRSAKDIYNIWNVYNNNRKGGDPKDPTNKTINFHHLSDLLDKNIENETISVRGIRTKSSFIGKTFTDTYHWSIFDVYNYTKFINTIKYESTTKSFMDALTEYQKISGKTVDYGAMKLPLALLVKDADMVGGAKFRLESAKITEAKENDPIKYLQTLFKTDEEFKKFRSQITQGNTRPDLFANMFTPSVIVKYMKANSLTMDGKTTGTAVSYDRYGLVNIDNTINELGFAYNLQNDSSTQVIVKCLGYDVVGVQNGKIVPLDKITSISDPSFNGFFPNFKFKIQYLKIKKSAKTDSLTGIVTPAEIEDITSTVTRLNSDGIIELPPAEKIDINLAIKNKILSLATTQLQYNVINQMDIVPTNITGVEANGYVLTLVPSTLANSKILYKEEYNKKLKDVETNLINKKRDLVGIGEMNYSLTINLLDKIRTYVSECQNIRQEDPVKFLSSKSLLGEMKNDPTNPNNLKLLNEIYGKTDPYCAFGTVISVYNLNHKKGNPEEKLFDGLYGEDVANVEKQIKDKIVLSYTENGTTSSTIVVPEAVSINKKETVNGNNVYYATATFLLNKIIYSKSLKITEYIIPTVFPIGKNAKVSGFPSFDNNNTIIKPEIYNNAQRYAAFNVFAKTKELTEGIDTTTSALKIIKNSNANITGSGILKTKLDANIQTMLSSLNTSGVQVYDIEAGKYCEIPTTEGEANGEILLNGGLIYKLTEQEFSQLNYRLESSDKPSDNLASYRIRSNNNISTYFFLRETLENHNSQIVEPAAKDNQQAKPTNRIGLFNTNDTQYIKIKLENEPAEITNVFLSAFQINLKVKTLAVDNANPELGLINKDTYIPLDFASNNCNFEIYQGDKNDKSYYTLIEIPSIRNAIKEKLLNLSLNQALDTKLSDESIETRWKNYPTDTVVYEGNGKTYNYDAYSKVINSDVKKDLIKLYLDKLITTMLGAKGITLSNTDVVLDYALTYITSDGAISATGITQATYGVDLIETIGGENKVVTKPTTTDYTGQSKKKPSDILTKEILTKIKDKATTTLTKENLKGMALFPQVIINVQTQHKKITTTNGAMAISYSEYTPLNNTTKEKTNKYYKTKQSGYKPSNIELIEIPGNITYDSASIRDDVDKTVANQKLRIAFVARDVVDVEQNSADKKSDFNNAFVNYARFYNNDTVTIFADDTVLFEGNISQLISNYSVETGSASPMTAFVEIPLFDKANELSNGTMPQSLNPIFNGYEEFRGYQEIKTRPGVPTGTGTIITGTKPRVKGTVTRFVPIKEYEAKLNALNTSGNGFKRCYELTSDIDGNKHWYYTEKNSFGNTPEPIKYSLVSVYKDYAPYTYDFDLEIESNEFKNIINGISISDLYNNGYPITTMSTKGYANINLDSNNPTKCFDKGSTPILPIECKITDLVKINIPTPTGPYLEGKVTRFVKISEHINELNALSPTGFKRCYQLTNSAGQKYWYYTEDDSISKDYSGTIYLTNVYKDIAPLTYTFGMALANPKFIDKINGVSISDLFNNGSEQTLLVSMNNLKKIAVNDEYNPTTTTETDPNNSGSNTELIFLSCQLNSKAYTDNPAPTTTNIPTTITTDLDLIRNCKKFTIYIEPAIRVEDANIGSIKVSDTAKQYSGEGYNYSLFKYVYSSGAFTENSFIKEIPMIYPIGLVKGEDISLGTNPVVTEATVTNKQMKSDNNGTVSRNVEIKYNDAKGYNASTEPQGVYANVRLDYNLDIADTKNLSIFNETNFKDGTTLTTQDLLDTYENNYSGVRSPLEKFRDQLGLSKGITIPSVDLNYIPKANDKATFETNLSFAGKLEKYKLKDPLLIKNGFVSYQGGDFGEVDAKGLFKGDGRIHVERVAYEKETKSLYFKYTIPNVYDYTKGSMEDKAYVVKFNFGDGSNKLPYSFNQKDPNVVSSSAIIQPNDFRVKFAAKSTNAVETATGGFAYVMDKAYIIKNELNTGPGGYDGELNTLTFVGKIDLSVIDNNNKGFISPTNVYLTKLLKDQDENGWTKRLQDENYANETNAIFEKVMNDSIIQIGVIKTDSNTVSMLTSGAIQFYTDDNIKEVKNIKISKVPVNTNPLENGNIGFNFNATNVYRSPAEGINLNHIYNSNEYRARNFIKDLNIAVDDSVTKGQSYSTLKSSSITYDIIKGSYKFETTGDLAGNDINSIKSYIDFNAKSQMEQNDPFVASVGELRTLKDRYIANTTHEINTTDEYQPKNIFSFSYNNTAPKFAYEWLCNFVKAVIVAQGIGCEHTINDATGKAVFAIKIDAKLQEPNAKTETIPVDLAESGDLTSVTYKDEKSNTVKIFSDEQIATISGVSGISASSIQNLLKMGYKDSKGVANDAFIKEIDTYFYSMPSNVYRGIGDVIYGVLANNISTAINNLEGKFKIDNKNGIVTKVIDFQIPIGSKSATKGKATKFSANADNGTVVGTDQKIILPTGTDWNNNVFLTSLYNSYSSVNLNGSGKSKLSAAISASNQTTPSIDTTNPRIVQDNNSNIIKVTDITVLPEVVDIMKWDKSTTTSSIKVSSITIPDHIEKNIEGLYFKIKSITYDFDIQDKSKGIMGADSSMQAELRDNGETVIANFNVITTSDNSNSFKVTVDNLNKEVYPIDYQYLSNYLYTINNNAKGDLSDATSNTIITENDLDVRDYEQYLLSIALIKTQDDVNLVFAKNIDVLEQQYNSYLQEQENSTSDETVGTKIENLKKHIAEVKEAYNEEKAKWGIVQTVISIVTTVAVVVVTALTMGATAPLIGGTLAGQAAIAGTVVGAIGSTVSVGASALEENATGDANYSFGLNYGLEGLKLGISTNWRHSKKYGLESSGFSLSVGGDGAGLSVGETTNYLTGQTVFNAGFNVSDKTGKGVSVSVDSTGNINLSTNAISKAAAENINLSVTVNPFVNGAFVRKIGANYSNTLVKTENTNVSTVLGLMVDTTASNFGWDDVTVQGGLTASQNVGVNGRAMASIMYNGNSNGANSAWTVSAGYAQSIDDKNNKGGLDGKGLGMEAWAMAGYTFGDAGDVSALSLNVGATAIQRAKVSSDSAQDAIEEKEKEGKILDKDQKAVYDSFMDKYKNTQDASLFSVTAGWVRDYTTGENNITYDAYIGSAQQVYDPNKTSVIKMTLNPYTHEMEHVDYSSTAVQAGLASGITSTMTAYANAKDSYYASANAGKLIDMIVEVGKAGETAAVDTSSMGIGGFDNYVRDRALERAKAMLPRDVSDTGVTDLAKSLEKGIRVELIKERAFDSVDAIIKKSGFALTLQQIDALKTTAFNSAVTENNKIAQKAHEAYLALQNSEVATAVQLANNRIQEKVEDAESNKVIKKIETGFLDKDGKPIYRDVNLFKVEDVKDLQNTKDDEEAKVQKIADEKGGIKDSAITIEYNGQKMSFEPDSLFMEAQGVKALVGSANPDNGKFNIDGFVLNNANKDGVSTVSYATTNASGKIQVVDINKVYKNVKQTDLTLDNITDMTVESDYEGKLKVAIKTTESYGSGGVIDYEKYTGKSSDNVVVNMDRITTVYTKLNTDGSIDTATMNNVSNLLKEVKTNNNIDDKNIISAVGEDNKPVTGDEPVAYLKIQQGIGATVGSDGQTKTQAFSIDYGGISTSISTMLFYNNGVRADVSQIKDNINLKIAQINNLNKAIEKSVQTQIENMNNTLATEFSKLDQEKMVSELNKVKESLTANFTNNLSLLNKLTDKIFWATNQSYKTTEEANKALENAISSVEAEMNEFKVISISEKKVVTLGLPAQEKALDDKRNLAMTAIQKLRDDNSSLGKYMQNGELALGVSDIENILLDQNIPDSVKKEFMSQRLFMEIYSTGNGNELGSLMSYNFAKFVQDNGLTDMFNELSFSNDKTYDGGKGIKLGNFMKNIVANGKNMEQDLSTWKSAINSGKVGGLDWLVDPKTGKYNSVIYASEAKKVLYTNNDGSFNKGVLIGKLDKIIKDNKTAYENGTMTTDQKKGYEMMQDMRAKADSYNSVVDIQKDGKTADLEYLAQASGVYKSDNLYSNGRPTDNSVMPGYDSTIKTAYSKNTLGPSNVMAMADYLVQGISASEIVKKLEENREKGAPVLNSTEGNKSLKLNGVNQSQGITMLNNPIPKTTATIAINPKSITPVNNSGTEVRATVRYTPMEFKEGTGTAKELEGEINELKSPQLPTTYTPDYLPLPIIKDGARTYNLQSKTGLNYVKYGYNSEMATTIRAVKPLDSNPDIQFDVFLENQ